MQRDPIANRVTHVDFMLIDIDQRLIVDVPIALVGDAVLVRQEGAVVQQQMMTLTVEAPAGNIPQVFEVDISEMSIDNSIRVSDLEMGTGEDGSRIASGQRSRAAVAAEETGGEDSDGLGEDAAMGGDAVEAGEASDEDAGEDS